MELTKQTTMGEMLEYDSGIAAVLMQSGMHCVGCHSSFNEALEQACKVHRLSTDAVFQSITQYHDTKNNDSQRDRQLDCLVLSLY